MKPFVLRAESQSTAHIGAQWRRSPGVCRKARAGPLHEARSCRVELEREHWRTVLTTQLSVILHVNGEVCLENRQEPIEA